MISFDRFPLTIDQLSTGTGDPILVVDFIEFASARRLSEVLSDHAGAHPVYRLDPVTDLARDHAYWPLAELADQYAGLYLGHGPGCGPMTVVGYCSAAALSWHIAARLADRVPLGLILVQPAWPDAQVVAAEFARFRAELDAEMTSVPDLGSDPRLALQQMQDILCVDLKAMAAGCGLDPASPSLSQLLDRYRSWLGFLLASSEVQRGRWTGKPHPWVLFGADADQFVPYADRASYRIVRLPMPGHAMLDNTNLADSVLARAWPK